MAKGKQIAARLKLKEPVQAHGEEISVLEFREPKGKDYKSISGKSLDAPFAMLLEFGARLADVPPSTMDELCREDVEGVVSIVGPFMPGYSHAVGESSATSSETSSSSEA